MAGSSMLDALPVAASTTATLLTMTRRLCSFSLPSVPTVTALGAWLHAPTEPDDRIVPNRGTPQRAGRSLRSSAQLLATNACQHAAKSSRIVSPSPRPPQVLPLEPLSAASPVPRPFPSLRVRELDLEVRYKFDAFGSRC